jgi:hypothetical protein
MQFAVTVVAPQGYVHSQAFREVAEGLHHGLLALGHDSLLTTRLDYYERHSIVLGSNLLALRRWEPPKKPILYNLEQAYGESPWMTATLLTLFRRHPVWDCSQANIEASPPGKYLG